MGKLIRGINGPFSGTVGDMVGSSLYGVPYIKSKYKKRTKPAGKGETSNRNKFADAHNWLKPIGPVVRDGFKDYRPRLHGFNAAKSNLLDYGFEGIQPNVVINPAKVNISWGTLPLPNSIAVERSQPNQLTFTWDTTRLEGTRNDDQIMMLAYDVEHKLACFKINGLFRRSGSDTIPIPDVPGYNYQIYCAFKAADRSSQSMSVYLGVIGV
ncbi:DUF6266 family protein [Pedobacter sp. MC2016-14]|uniref:DUF6266 family protein n=1 Tax=Pedobacter sp. MC2016-14 TaxID=2897327 RepID=UPI001E601745|nr:DUF6266 family protein [Pedobacter sp. MC2016-14]MCD0489951.1 DUF6266 family protein [Pedobacter sp. MC2016-14]